MHSSTLSFICTADNSVTIYFSRKRYISVSTTRVIQTRDRGAKKFGNLKYFEVRSVHKKEPWDKQIRSINPIGMVIWLKNKMKVEISPDRVIRVSVRSVPALNEHLVGLRYLCNNFRTDRLARVNTHHEPDREENKIAIS
jgi:hypothetical protein